MDTVGIVAEYNPFHNGHKYQIEAAKALSGCERALAIMSGDFVQRGESAMIDKYTRARWAIENGASMVMELPCLFSLSCAEIFALGAMKLLDASAIVSHVCFGAETDNMETLLSLSHLAANESIDFQMALKPMLKGGLSYPRAQHETLKAMGLSNEVVAASRSPNNILGVEYIKALARLDSSIIPHAILRKQAMHDDGMISGEIASASAIRSELTMGNADKALLALPKSVGRDISDMLAKNQNGLITNNLASDIILYKLRELSKSDIARLPDVIEGLENVIYRECRAATTYYEFLTKVKSKRYTLSRIKRIACAALVSMTCDSAQNALSFSDSLFLRVLAVRRDSLDLLSQMSKLATLPVITRGADYARLSQNALSVLAVNKRSNEVYALLSHLPCVDDASRPVIII